MGNRALLASTIVALIAAGGLQPALGGVGAASQAGPTATALAGAEATDVSVVAPATVGFEDPASSQAAPAVPIVTSSHEDGVPTSQTELVAQFASGDGRIVDRWAVAVDQHPDTVPDPATSSPESQYTGSLQPGDWWLHVTAGDGRGAWSAPAHHHIVITAAESSVMVSPGTWVWAATEVKAACNSVVDAFSLAAIDAAGEIRAIGPLQADGDACTGAWDPLATIDGGRVWPDGEYSLVVQDAEGVVRSEPVPVVVAVHSTIVERLEADYRVGRLAAQELADLLVGAIVGQAPIPPRYADGASEGGLSLGTILAALDALGAEEREDALDRLGAAAHPEAGTGLQEEALDRLGAAHSEAGTGLQTVGIASSTTPEPNCYSSPFGTQCGLDYPDFYIAYVVEEQGAMAPDGIPEDVHTVYDALVWARESYAALGFRVPSGQVDVNLRDDFPLLGPGAGFSLPNGSITMHLLDPDPVTGDSRVTYYLPMHEYFHQVQYEYVNEGDHLSEPYWWMEATAEWAAHQAQIAPNFPEAKTSTYAGDLPLFLGAVSEPLALPETAVLEGGGREYGAFILAEYLEEKFGADAIRWTWSRINDGIFGIAPLDAIDDLAQAHGVTYGDAIEEFRLWTYFLDRSQGSTVGFTDADANPGGFWRDSLTRANFTWPMDDAFGVDPATGFVSDSVSVPSSNTAFVLIDAAAVVGGTATARVSGRLEDADSGGIRASTFALGGYPTQCRTPRSLQQIDGTDVLELERPVPASCDTVVLAITNTSKQGDAISVDWSLEFEARPLHQPWWLSQTLSVAPASVSTLAGSGTAAVVDGSGTGASLKEPRGFHVEDGFGYVFDTGRLRRVDLATGEVTTVAGTGTPGYFDDTDPFKATVSGSGPMIDDGNYLYFTNACGGYSEYSCLRRMSLADGAISTLTQRNRSSGYVGLVIGPDGALYGASGSTIDQIDTTASTTTIAFTLPIPQPTGRYSVITSMTADSSYLWLSVYDRTSSGGEYNPRVVRVDPATGAMVSFPVGTGQSRYTQITSAGLYLYAVTGYRVVRMTKSTGETVVIAGQPGTEPGYANGTGADAWFGTLQAITSDGTRLYVVDPTNARIRALS